MILLTQSMKNNYFTEHHSNSIEALSLIQKLIDINPKIRDTTQKYFLEAGSIAIPYLECAVGHESAAIRWEAVKLLSALNTSDVLPLLISSLEDDVSSIRWMAARGIIMFKETGILALLKRLSAHPKLDIPLRLLIFIFKQPIVLNTSSLSTLVQAVNQENILWPGGEIEQAYHSYKKFLENNTLIDDPGER